MASSIEDLQKSLQDILQVLKKTGSAQTGGGGGGAGTPKTLKDQIAGALQHSQSRYGGGIAKAIAGRAGSMAGGGGGGQAASLMAGRVTSMGSGSSATSGMMGGAAGGIAGGLIAIGIELVKLPGRVRELAEHLHEANRQFAQFSPSMGLVMAQSDFRDSMRKMKQGEELSASAGRLADARGKLEDQMVKPETEWEKLKNNFGAALSKGMATFLDKSGYSDQAAAILKEFNEFVFGKDTDKKEDTWVEELDELVLDERRKLEDRRRPVRHPQGGRPGRDPRPDLPWDKKGGNF